MASSIPAIVTPEVLQWARELDQINVDEIAKQMKVNPEKIRAWENGSEQPTLTQAKSLAKKYRIPFVFLYLPDKPLKIKRLERVDYRTFPNITEGVQMSRELRWILRDIEERRDIMLRLYEIEDVLPKGMDNQFPENARDSELAGAIRSLLGLTLETQMRFRKPEEALSHCIAQLERRDLLVFQATGIEPNEMRGLSIAYDIFPIVVLNRKDAPSARLFTLCHELVHILTRTSGICNDTTEISEGTHQTELMCNRIAGLTLVPTDLLKENKNTKQLQAYGFDDSYIYALSRDFAVSREVIINRLWQIKIMDKAKYFDTLKRYTEEFIAYKKSKQTQTGFLPPALDKGSQVGKLYARTVLGAYFAEKITPREASGYLLNLRIQHFSKIESWCY